MVMSEEQWDGWLREEWGVVPSPDGSYNLNDYTGQTWMIVLRKHINQPAGLLPSLGERYEDEEVARHICRAHNYYLSGLRHDGDFSREEMSDGRGSEPKEP
jgi:hypothetical protein